MDFQATAPRPSLFVALATAFTLTLRQLLRGWRLIILAVLFAIPAVLALTARMYTPPAPPKELEFALLLNFLPVALVPLTCLLYSSTLVQDEIEEQTLTYMLLRPIPRGLLYLTRLLATYAVVLALTVVFTVITTACVWWGSDGSQGNPVQRTAALLPILALTTFAYTALFGALSLFQRRLLLFGIVYIVLIEGVLGSIDFVLRRVTVVYYFRVLSLNWIDDTNQRKWGITLTSETTPGVVESLICLAAIGLVAVVLGVWRFRSTEYKVKTPGES